MVTLQELQWRCQVWVCFATLNYTLQFAEDVLSFIDSKRKGLYREDHTSNPFASDELKQFREALVPVKVPHEEFQNLR